MFRTVKVMVVSALLGAGAFSLAPASAHADSIYFSLGVGGPRADVFVDDGYRRANEWRRPGWDRPPPPDRGWGPPPDRRWGPPRDRWGPPPGAWERREMRDCTARAAIRKAYRMGFDRPFIARDNRRIIVVAGRTERGRDWVTFARVPGCPVVR
ncbi:MAG: hypothetical protein KF874_13315 [Rhizobiaceae bacterium]|nr:hypothetical protein [Rhizobiaceae bacterium]